ncbi:iron uptake porin [Pseudanabaena sp. UWO311]|uniref:iron uptake porin n=1 Tax=Pseudanabaena sp. UWO311 TaxID=2487337 RepID=UPI00115B6294|nr:iron uptake porin [Pseudanabaena sp. UWO311]TYQ23234.1 iron uptake porin [Pseudanabaena sp. UWO311]
MKTFLYLFLLGLPVNYGGVVLAEPIAAPSATSKSTNPVAKAPVSSESSDSNETRKLLNELNQQKLNYPSALQNIPPSKTQATIQPTAQNVTSISQLSDVRSTDWAFTALQSLVERYGCIAGYPDRSFRGQRSISRYEFAAGVNACLDKINEIISSGLADKVSQEDLAALKKLQEEFAAELATLRGRVDALDAKTAKLESQQFSTTTKLYGQAIFGLQGRFGNTADLNPRDGVKDTRDPAATLTYGYNLQLTLLTQLSDRGYLITGLQSGNLNTGAGFSNAPYFLNDTFTRLGYESDTGNRLSLSDLSYRYRVSDNLALIVGPQGVNPITVFRGPNRYESAGQGAISAFAQRNPILGLGNTQAGLGIDWQISDRASLQAVYSAGNGFDSAANPTGSGGLFNGPSTIGVQLAMIPIDRLDTTLYYLNSYSTNALLGTSVGDNIIGSLGSRLSTNAFGANLSWRASRNLILGTWGGYTTTNVLGAGLSGSVETTNWMVYLNMPNLLSEGDLAGIYVGQPPKITSSTISLNGVPALNLPSAISGTGGIFGAQPASTTHVELFYRFRMSNNISVTPGVLFLFNPVNTSSSDMITVGTLRTTFSF